jgi:regulator of cell morphogenesis and NO signaling
VKNALPLLLEYTQKVANVHGDRHPQAIQIAEIFVEVANELTSHMMKEERILFPYIKQMAANAVSGEAVSAAFGTIKNPVNMMEHEHDSVGEMFESIRLLADDYTPPTGACATFRVSYAKLKEFEDDLHRHIHLENNVLFPRSITLESQLQG